MLQWQGGAGRSWWYAVFAVLAIGVIALRWSPASDATAPEAPLPLLPGAAIALESGFDLERVYSGQIMSYHDAGLGFEVAGVVDAVLVTEGQAVSAGQLLARLRSAEQKAAVAEQEAVVAQMEAAMEEAAARLRLAELVRERRRQLSSRELLAAEDMELAETDHDSQLARLRSAEAAAAQSRATLARLQVKLDQTELRAPYSGRVAAIPARAGQALDAGAPALRLVDLSRSHVHVGLPAAVADTLEVGAGLTLVVAGERHPVRLLSLAPAVDAPARTVLAVLAPEAPVPSLRVGQLIRVEVSRRLDQRGAWMPLSALVEGRRGLWAGYFLDQRFDAGANPLQARIERRPLQVVRVGDDRAFVRGPFADGDVYLRTALHRAVPGQEVRVTLD